jgi:hypothetical protein
MKTINRYKALSFFLITAFLLAACGGTLSQATDRANSPRMETRNVVAFTGIVEAMNGTQWTIGGQTVTLDPQVSLDPDITAGDEVKVEANVSADGGVVALNVESSARDEIAATPSVDASSTPETSPTQEAGNTENEIFGAVEALTAGTIMVNGVTYTLAQGFTEIKDALLVGDQVKLHVIVNVDGTFTVREVEKSTNTFDDNSSGSDDGPGHNVGDDNSNGNSNDDSDDHSDDNGNNDNSNDDEGENSNTDSGGD